MLKGARTSLAVLIAVPLIFSTIACDDDSSLPTMPAASTGTSILPVYYQPQTTQDWSWAAASAMAMVFHSGGNIYQCMLASARANQTGVNCCAVPADACYGVPSVSEVVDAISGGITAGDYGVAGQGGLEASDVVYAFAATSMGPLDMDEVESIIGERRPIIVRFDGSFPGHHAVIYGYDEEGQLLIHDPAFGSFTVPYGTTFSYTGQVFTWTDTIIVVRQSL